MGEEDVDVNGDQREPNRRGKEGIVSLEQDIDESIQHSVFTIFSIRFLS